MWVRWENLRFSHDSSVARVLWTRNVVNVFHFFFQFHSWWLTWGLLCSLEFWLLFSYWYSSDDVLWILNGFCWFFFHLVFCHYSHSIQKKTKKLIRINELFFLMFFKSVQKKCNNSGCEEVKKRVRQATKGDK